MKVELEYINGKKAFYEDVLDVVFCDFDIEIYLKRDDVTVLSRNEIKSIMVMDL